MGARACFPCEGWTVGAEEGGFRRRRGAEQGMPKRMSHAPKAGTAHAVGRAGSHLIPPAPGKGSVESVLGKMCPRQPGDGPVLWSPPVGHSRSAWPRALVLPSTGPHSRGEAPPREAAWEGARRMCVSCRRALPPASTLGAGEGMPACGCPAGSPEGWSPPVPLPAVLGPRDKTMTLRQVSSLGTPLWAQPP